MNLVRTNVIIGICLPFDTSSQPTTYGWQIVILGVFYFDDDESTGCGQWINDSWSHAGIMTPSFNPTNGM